MGATLEKRPIVDDRGMCCTKASEQPGVITAAKGRGSLSRRPEIGLNAKMHGEIATVEPHAAASSKLFRLRYFAKAKEAGIERARLLFATDGNGKLDMVEIERTASHTRIIARKCANWVAFCR